MDDDNSSDSCTESRIPYLRLLNTLANDLDYMLNDLYTTPPSTLRIGGDAFLEPYMQGLSNDVNHTIDEVFDGSSNVFKKRLHDDYMPHDDRMSSFSSPVDSVDTPLDDKGEHFIIEVNAGSQGSLNQLISGDECSESSSLNSSLVGDEETPCDITLVERLIRSHPIWFLPGIQRAGAFHLLQGKEDGNFVVRQSSQNSTMAISVRLPSGKGPYIEHYLIQGSEDGQIGLESSENKFPSIPLLIAHYCQCCDELPVQLTLPRAIRDAKNRQQLTSLALLGQEFWRYPMANPRQSLKMEDESPSSLSTMAMPLKESNNAPQMQNTSFLGSSSSNSPASSLSSFESRNNNNNSSCSALEQPSLVFDLDSSNIPPDESSSQNNSLMTTFKGSPQFSSIPYNQIGIPVTPESPSSLPVETSHSQVCIRRPRPTPPNTLNLMSTTASTISCRPDTTNTAVVQSQLVTPTSKTPPPPPPRWTKPSLTNCTSTSPNFTVTTTLTFTVNKDKSPSPDLKVSPSPPIEKPAERHISTQIVHATSLTASLPTIAPTPLPRSHIPHITSPTSPSQTSQVLSPVSEGNTRPFNRRHRRHHKESNHYQESDIIEPSYHRSTLADKVSDYEDLWAQDSSLVSTFKPQPPPRSLPPSIEDVSLPSTKSVFRKISTSPLSNEMAPEKPATPSSTPEPNKNRFGLVLDVSGGEVVPLTPNCDAVTPVSSSVEPSMTSTPEAATPAEPPKLGSPFYAEPADAIKQAAAALKRRTKPPVFTPQPSIRNRHSEPSSLHQWPPIVLSGGGNLERIDSKEELITNGSFSSSVDNLVALRKPRYSNGSTVSASNPFSKNVKPVEPPKIGLNKNKGGDWALDSSWEFFAKEGHDDEDAKSDKNLTVSSTSERGDEMSPEPENTSSNRSLTVQEMIAQKLPKLRLSPVFDRDKNTSSRLNSSLDTSNNSNGNDSNNNSDKVYHNGLSVLSQVSDTSDTQTEFSEPWDSSQWDYLFTKVTQAPQEESTNNQSRCRSFKERLDPLLSPPRLKALARTRVTATTPGAAVRNYALRLAADKDTVFAQNIDNFISCTKESKETKPLVVMRNMRQFMSGMKNYLVTHGEREFIKEVERERSKLKSTEFLNLDAILEGVMHKLVICPLKEHLLTLFVQEYSASGAIQLLGDNIVHARTKPPHELGIKERLILPSEEDIERIYNLFTQMQSADSPLEKLELLLSAIAIIFHSVKVSNSGPEGVFLGADDFLPIFVWVLVRTGMVAAEIEAEYMWGLLHPSLLSGEGGYYLTTLSSAVNVLKNFRPVNENSAISRLSWCHEQLSEFRSIFKVVVPDEMNGSLLTKTLPVRPNSTTKDICKIIAHKLRITNPQDYSLFKLVEGEETPMNDSDCPQDMKIELAKAGKHCIFAYKRLDAKIAWPTTTTSQTVKL
ncbi:protein sprint isoform X2 [Planococcus citri]|uniref:protein sprint isoform X2 n=1 Tax=Planococcus citri TaxID=170843 RepID=UPI0031F73BF9